MPRVGLFGGVTIALEDTMVSSSLGQRADELFAYLTLHSGMPHRREKLAELVWPEKAEQRSRSSLNTTIWRINGLLRSIGVESHIRLESATHASIMLQLSTEVYVDCHALRQSVRESELAVRDRGSLSVSERFALSADLEGYAGVFLEGHDSDWVLRERERLHCLYIRGQALLMHDLTRDGRFEEALECGRAILATDEMREAVQREVMWLYVMNGQRSEAIAQYRKFRARAKKELGIEPMSETTALYQHVLSDADSMAVAPTDRALASLDRATIRSFLRQCGHSRASVYSALVARDSQEI